MNPATRTSLPTRLLALAALTLSLGACVTPAPSAESRARHQLRSASLGGMRNVTRAGATWSGGRPSREDLDLAERRGVRRVLDLRGYDEIDEEESRVLRSICDQVGLGYRRTPLPIDLEAEEASRMSDRILELLHEEPSTLLVCVDGTRSAAIAILHQVALGATPPDEALERLARVASAPKAVREFLRTEASERAPRPVVDPHRASNSDLATGEDAGAPADRSGLGG